MADARRRLLWGALALTLIGVVLAARVEESAPPATRESRRGAAPARTALPPAQAAGTLEAPAPPIDFDRLRRAPFDAALAAGIAQAWEPPPPAPPSAAALAAQKAALTAKAPPPQAPTLPFRVIGIFNDGTSTAAIVQSGQVVHVLRPGDVVERNYRVEAVNEKEATLMYLPLNILQKLDLGAAP